MSKFAIILEIQGVIWCEWYT